MRVERLRDASICRVTFRQIFIMPVLRSCILEAEEGILQLQDLLNDHSSDDERSVYCCSCQSAVAGRPQCHRPFSEAEI